jgi:predicted permease
MGVGLTGAVVILGILHGSTRPLPVPRGQEIVSVALLDARARPVAFPPGPVAGWATGAGLEAVAGLQPTAATMVLPEVPAIRAYGAAMEPDAFPLLGVRPALGRWPTLAPDDAEALVLGWDTYQALGGTSSILGTEVRLDGVPHTVVAIMPPGFGFPENHGYWTVLPAAATPQEVVGRLAAGVGPRAAALALETRMAARQSLRAAGGPYRVRVASWVGGRGEGGEAVAFGALAGLVAFLVIICAANVSTLLLVRATERAGTLAVHAALGAVRAQVAFQLFAEALLVALAGGVVGLAGGAAVLHWAEVRLSDHWGYYWMRMEVRPDVLLGALAVVMGAAVLAGTVPALRASRVDLRDVLAGHGRGASGWRQRRLGRWFVGVQVTLSTIGMLAALYLGAGLVRTGDLGADLPLEEVAVGAISPGPGHAAPAARAALVADLRRELVRIPGVLSATVSAGIPGFENRSASVMLPGDDPAGESERAVPFLAIGEGFRETYDVRLLAGRDITPDDHASAPPVVLVTRSYGVRHLAGTDPLGTRLHVVDIHGVGAWAEVVGVVDDWYPDNPGVRPDRILLPLAQAPAGPMRISVRTAGPPADVLPELRHAVSRVDPTMAVERAETLASLMAWLLRMPRALAAFGMAGGLAGVLVAAIGLYGVISFQVRTRLPEIGVRMALGAGAGRILAEIVRETMVRVLPGVIVGLALAALVAPAFTMLVRGVDPHAPLLYLAALSAMAGVALLAALEPALRAARLEPQTVLRSE